MLKSKKTKIVALNRCLSKKLALLAFGKEIPPHATDWSLASVGYKEKWFFEDMRWKDCSHHAKIGPDIIN